MTTIVMNPDAFRFMSSFDSPDASARQAEEIPTLVSRFHQYLQDSGMQTKDIEPMPLIGASVQGDILGTDSLTIWTVILNSGPRSAHAGMVFHHPTNQVFWVDSFDQLPRPILTMAWLEDFLDNRVGQD